MLQLDGCISYWQDMLANQKAFLNPSVVVIIEATIIYLQALKVMKRVKK